MSAQLQYSQQELSKKQITAISTAGNLRIDRKTILDKVRSRQDGLFDEKTASEDVKRISQIPGVQSCWYSIKAVDGKIELTFVVIEQNIVRQIEFAGNKGFKKSTLEKKLDFKKSDFLEATLAEGGREKILEYYLQNGYPFATVELDYKSIETGFVRYAIKEGARVRIQSISYTGNRQIPNNQLKNITKLKRKNLIFWPNWYNEAQIQKEIANITNAYDKRGFLNIEVDCVKKFNSDQSKVQLVFKISEGNIFRVNKITFKGNKGFDIQTLSGALTIREGEVCDKLKAAADTKELIKKYRESGFINAVVDPNIMFVNTDKVDVEFLINEGDRFRIGQIEIVGNTQTQDRVIRRILDEYDFTPGRFYNGDIARGDGTGYLERLVKSTAYTESATIRPFGEKQGQADAVVNVVEGKTGMVMAGAGVSADAGVIGQIVYDERNFDIKGRPKNLWDVLAGRAFKGAGQELRIALEPGTEISQYSVSFTEPYLNDKPLSLNLTGAQWQRFWESYEEQRLKGYIELEKRYKDRWRRSIAARLENIDVTEIDIDAPKEIRDVKGKNFLTGVHLGIGRTITDDRFNPSSGFVFDAGYEQVFGDFTFGKLSGFYQRFYTIGTDLADRKTVLSTKIYGATTLGDAPPFEKYYAGGSGPFYGIRGFDYRGVSTRGLPTNPDGSVIPGRKRKDPIGSDWIALANAELNFPLVGDNISWFIFMDSGLIDTGGPRASAGAGIQILIPRWFGPVPMRFELANPFMKEDEDETRVFSFSIGRLF